MAISPNDALRSANLVGAASLAKVEAVIDRKLSELFQSDDRPVCIDVPEIERESGVKLDAAMQKAVIKLYGSVGWSVRRFSHQREGEWLQFENAAYLAKITRAYYDK